MGHHYQVNEFQPYDTMTNTNYNGNKERRGFTAGYFK